MKGKSSRRPAENITLSPACCIDTKKQAVKKVRLKNIYLSTSWWCRTLQEWEQQQQILSECNSQGQRRRRRNGCLKVASKREPNNYYFFLLLKGTFTHRFTSFPLGCKTRPPYLQHIISRNLAQRSRKFIYNSAEERERKKERRRAAATPLSPAVFGRHPRCCHLLPIIRKPFQGCGEGISTLSAHMFTCEATSCRGASEDRPQMNVNHLPQPRGEKATDITGHLDSEDHLSASECCWSIRDSSFQKISVSMCDPVAGTIFVSHISLCYILNKMYRLIRLY